MRWLYRLAAGLIGGFVLWLAVSVAINPAMVRPSTTEPEDPAARAAIARTWYGETARYASAALLGFLGVTIAAAPWRGRQNSTGERS